MQGCRALWSWLRAFVGLRIAVVGYLLIWLGMSVVGEEEFVRRWGRRGSSGAKEA